MSSSSDAYENFDETEEVLKCEQILEAIFDGKDSPTSPTRRTVPARAARVCNPRLTLNAHERMVEEVKNLRQLTSSPQKKVRGHHYYARVRCNNSQVNAELTTVPPIPKDLPENASVQRILKHKARTFLRREICERLGLKRGDKKADIRYCKCHETEVITRSFEEGGFRIKCEWNVPKNT